MAERQTVALRAELRRRLADEETEVRISGAAVEAVRAARLGAGRFSAGAPGAADVEAAEARYGSAVAARDRYALAARWRAGGGASCGRRRAVLGGSGGL